MKQTNNILLVGVVLLAFSCNKVIDINEPESSERTMTFTCVIADETPDSKVSLDVSNGKTEWEIGDEIMIHGGKDGATFQMVTLQAGDISADGKTATIKMTYMAPYDRTPDVVSQYYAQYPASAVPTGSNMYYECRFNDTKNLLMGACNVGSTFVFYHLSAIIAYTVSDDSAPDDFATAVFSGNNGEAVAYDVYQARIRQDKDKDPRCYYWKPGNGSGTPAASTTYTSVPATDGTTVNYIYLTSGVGAVDRYNVSYSGVNFTNGFTIKFLNAGGDEVQRVSTSTPKTVHAGEVLNLGNITSRLYTYTPPAKHDSTIGLPADGSEYDLSKTASANCYIVDGSNAANANKVFKFKAYKGKGTTGVGKIASVEVLWSTQNTAVAPSDGDIIAAVDYDKQTANDYYEICFKTPETIHAGNALIAAKNSSGDVLWSWHIWIPTTSISSSTYGGVSKVRMMDRNLGALVIAEGDADTDIDVTSCGLFYQWGRKDPFPGPGNLLGEYNSSSAAVFGTVNTRAATASADIYKYPNSFVQTGGDGDGTKDWSTDHSSSLWGSVKNENDPCPPGWKLPIFASSTDDLWDKGVTDKTGLAGYALNATHHWLKLGVDYDDLNPTTTGYTYFPLAGYRTQNNSDYAYAGGRALIWQAYGESGEYAKCLYSDGSFVGYRTERKGRGGNVRCVAE